MFTSLVHQNAKIRFNEKLYNKKNVSLNLKHFVMPISRQENVTLWMVTTKTILCNTTSGSVSEWWMKHNMKTPILIFKGRLTAIAVVLNSLLVEIVFNAPHKFPLSRIYRFYSVYFCDRKICVQYRQLNSLSMHASSFILIIQVGISFQNSFFFTITDVLQEKLNSSYSHVILNNLPLLSISMVLFSLYYQKQLNTFKYKLQYFFAIFCLFSVYFETWINAQIHIHYKVLYYICNTNLIFKIKIPY